MHNLLIKVWEHTETTPDDSSAKGLRLYAVMIRAVAYLETASSLQEISSRALVWQNSRSFRNPLRSSATFFSNFLASSSALTQASSALALPNWAIYPWIGGCETDVNAGVRIVWHLARWWSSLVHNSSASSNHFGQVWKKNYCAPIWAHP